VHKKLSCCRETARCFVSFNISLNHWRSLTVIRNDTLDGQRVASYDTSLVVSGGVDCRRRWRNVYDKKPQRYAKDNRTAHLTARSDKSVAYVTNNKRLYSTFCTVEADYWQIRSIARPLCYSRSTYINKQLHLYKIVCFCKYLFDSIYNVL